MTDDGRRRHADHGVRRARNTGVFYLREAARFLGWQWPQLVVAPLLALSAITLLHELAHAAAVLMQGGEVTAISFLPTASQLGYTRYRFPPGATPDLVLISLAPVLMWTSVAALAVMLSLRGAPRPRWRASLIFVWLYVVPLLDVGLHLFYWALGSIDNDLAHALGPASGLASGFTLLGLGGLLLFSHSVQRWCYREHALSPPAYLMVCVICGAGVGLLSAGVQLL